MANELLEQLSDLGRGLPVSAAPTVADTPAVLAGLVYYLETGSLAPPVDDTPDAPTVAAAQAEQTRVAELETQLREAERRNAAADAGPSPVAPPPIAPPETLATTPPINAAEARTTTVDPTPLAPVDPTSPGGGEVA